MPGIHSQDRVATVLSIEDGEIGHGRFHFRHLHLNNGAGCARNKLEA